MPPSLLRVIYILYINSVRPSVTELGSVTDSRPGPAQKKRDSDESANLTDGAGVLTDRRPGPARQKWYSDESANLT
jgi:hypothetical protein